MGATEVTCVLPSVDAHRFWPLGCAFFVARHGLVFWQLLFSIYGNRLVVPNNICILLVDKYFTCELLAPVEAQVRTSKKSHGNSRRALAIGLKFYRRSFSTYLQEPSMQMYATLGEMATSRKLKDSSRKIILRRRSFRSRGHGRPLAYLVKALFFTRKFE